MRLRAGEDVGLVDRLKRRENYPRWANCQFYKQQYCPNGKIGVDVLWDSEAIAAYRTNRHSKLTYEQFFDLITTLESFGNRFDRPKKKHKAFTLSHSTVSLIAPDFYRRHYRQVLPVQQRASEYVPRKVNDFAEAVSRELVQLRKLGEDADRDPRAIAVRNFMRFNHVDYNHARVLVSTVGEIKKDYGGIE